MRRTNVQKSIVCFVRTAQVQCVLFAVGEVASGAELRVLLYSTEGSSIMHGQVAAEELFPGESNRDEDLFDCRSPVDMGDGNHLKLPPGYYRLHVAALGFAPYQGEVTVGSEPQVVRIGLQRAHAEAVAFLRGRVIRPVEDTRQLWVDLQPVYEIAWPLRVLNNTALRDDGSFAFSALPPGLYTLFVFGDRADPENTPEFEVPYELLRAQVVRVEGDVSVEIELDSLPREQNTPTLRIAAGSR
jgi:hypothetical protein